MCGNGFAVHGGSPRVVQLDRVRNACIEGAKRGRQANTFYLKGLFGVRF